VSTNNEDFGLVAHGMDEVIWFVTKHKALTKRLGIIDRAESKLKRAERILYLTIRRHDMIIYCTINAL